MASTKSQSIQDYEAQPRQFLDHRILGGKVRVAQELIVTAAADGAGHIHAITLIPSRAILLSCILEGPATTGMTGCDCGIYTLDPGNDPVVVSGGGDIIFDGEDLSGGKVTPSEMLGLGTNGRAPSEANTPVWEIAGLSADPRTVYVVGLSVAGDVSDPTTWAFSLYYSDGA